MFNNLIESSSHRKEFQRRGSFLLFTTATYLLLFVITGVVSIYAYDAHLDSQTTELSIITFVPPEAPEEPAPAAPRNTIRPASDSSETPVRSTRTALVDSPSNPLNVPKDVGTIASSVPPARSDSIVGDRNVDPIGPPSTTRGVPGGTGTTPIVIDIPEPPATPTPTPAPVKLIKKSVVLNSEALSLPKPKYPPMAVQIRLQGMVSVQVLIDESGRVVSAKTVSGHPILSPEAQRAALQAKFSPTTVGGQPVKVSGVITYNFLLSN
jgi:periplasmic protein TonB